MKIRYKSNLCGGILSLIISIVLFLVIPRQIGEDPASTVAYGITSRSVPYAMAVLILICGIWLIFQSLVLKKDTVKELVVKREAFVLVYMVSIWVFSLLYKKSFLLATLFLGGMTLALLRCKKPLYYIIEVVVIFALFFIFTRLLNVRLPALLL